MQEDIKILEEMVEKSRDLREEDFYKLITIKQIQAISSFIKAYKDIETDLYSANCIINEQIDIINNSVDKDKIKEIPQGSYYVQSYRPNRSGKLFLYVVINDHVEKIPTELTSIDQDYVYLKEGLDGYEVSLTPFRGTRKK